MHRTRRPAIVLIVALATLLLLAAPALGDYPPQAGTVVDADVIVENPDATVEIDGEDWGPDTVVEITYDDGSGSAQVLGETTTDADGSFTTAVTLPDGVDPGDVTFTAAEAGGGDSTSFTLAGTDADDGARADDGAGGDDATAGTGGDAPALATTGAPTGAMALALTLLTAGGAAVGGARWWSARLDARG